MRDSRASSSHRLADEAEAEDRLLVLVEQLHAPFGFRLQATRDAAEQIGADRSHLGPGGRAILELIGLVGGTGIATGTDAEEVQRHRRTFVPPGPYANWDASSYQGMKAADRMPTA